MLAGATSADAPMTFLRSFGANADEVRTGGLMWTLESELLHALEHLSFLLTTLAFWLLTALAFWTIIIEPRGTGLSIPRRRCYFSWSPW